MVYNRQRGTNTLSTVGQLYALAQAGKLAWNTYARLKTKPVAIQKKAITAAKGRGKTTRRGGALVRLDKQVKDIKYRLNNDMATHTNRNIDVLRIKSDFGEQKLTHIEMNTSTRLEGAVANLRYYDPSNPATLITADGAAGGYSRQLTIRNVNCTTTFRNNFLVPANLVIYEVVPRDDTSLDPESTVINGMVDQYQISPTTTQPNTYPSDIDQFREIWRIVKTTKKKLQAGMECEYKYNSGKYTFDPSVFDSHPFNYQKQYKASVLLIKVYGDLCHSSTAAAQIGLMEASLDVWTIRTVQIEYDAGTSLNDYSIEDNSTSAFSSPVLSNKAEAIQQFGSQINNP